MSTERSLLLEVQNNPKKRYFTSGLSAFFATICIIDVFGVFPIVALPKTIINCGIYGPFLVLVVASIQIYTASLLGKCWLLAENIDPAIEGKSRYPYSAIAEMTYGLTFSKFVTFLLDITIFAGGIPNLIVASQNLQILGLRVSENELSISYCYWIIIIGAVLCPLMWIGSPKDMKLICTISVIMVLVVFTSVLGCIIFDFEGVPQDPIAPPRKLPLWENIILAYGILSFQFDLHPTILTIQVDMNDKTKVRRSIIGGFSASLLMFSLITIAAYLRYGESTNASLLSTLPSSIWLNFAALLVALQLGLTSAVSNSALYQHMEDCLGISREFNHKRCFLRTFLCICAILLAESVPGLELIMTIIGGTFIGPVVFILPPLFYIKMCMLKKRHEETLTLETFQNLVYNLESTPSTSQTFTEIESTTHLYKVEIIICSLIILFGTCSTISTTYLNIRNTIDYATFSQPCIYNLTFVSPF